MSFRDRRTGPGFLSTRFDGLRHMLGDLACMPQNFRIFHAECDRLLHFGVRPRVVPACGERPGVGIQSEGILSVPQDTWTFHSTGPYLGMTKLLWYKMANQSMVRADVVRRD